MAAVRRAVLLCCAALCLVSGSASVDYSCPVGWDVVGDTCWRAGRAGVKTWEEAKEACTQEAVGAQLLMPSRTEINNTENPILRLQEYGLSEVWIGIESVGGKLRWTDGYDVGLPAATISHGWSWCVVPELGIYTTDRDICGYLSISDHSKTHSAKACLTTACSHQHTKLPYVCQINALHRSTPVTKAASTCPPDWYSTTNGWSDCLLYGATKRTFHEAQNECIAHGGVLSAPVVYGAEHQLIRKVFNKENTEPAHVTSRAWTGPQLENGSCIANGVNYLTSRPCSEQLPFVCQKPAVARCSLMTYYGKSQVYVPSEITHKLSSSTSCQNYCLSDPDCKAASLSRTGLGCVKYSSVGTMVDDPQSIYFIKLCPELNPEAPVYSIVSSSGREVAGVCHTSRDDSALCQYMLEGGDAVSDPGRQCNTVYRQSFSDDADDWDNHIDNFYGCRAYFNGVGYKQSAQIFINVSGSVLIAGEYISRRIPFNTSLHGVFNLFRITNQSEASDIRHVIREHATVVKTLYRLALQSISRSHAKSPWVKITQFK